MSNLFKAALLLGGLLWQSMGLASDTGWLTSPQNDHARVRLQADRSTADQTRILLDVELESGWKTYWHSPGEGGIAPQILWDEPVGDFQWRWPVPRHFEVAGLSTQGYQGDVTFPLSLNYPTGQPLKGTLRLSTCSNVCILTDFPFTLAVDGQAPADFDFAWAKAMSTLPQQLPAETRVELGYQHNQLQLRAERAEGWQSPALFIDALEGAEFGKPALEVEGNTLIARVPVSDGWQGDAPDLRGQSLGLLLTSGEQAWQGKGTIGAPLALPNQSHSLFWLLEAALLGGLILNLMPCVLPVLALKLGTVLQHQKREQGAVRKQFLAASAGIIASFWVLAAMSSLLRATQGAVGWGIQFQSAGFIGLMVLVTMLFCANLLGLFEIRLPSALSTPPRHQRRQRPRRSLPAGELRHSAGDPLLGTLSRHRGGLCAGGATWPALADLHGIGNWHEPALAAGGSPATARPLVAETGALDEPSAHPARPDDAGLQPLAHQPARQSSRQLCHRLADSCHAAGAAELASSGVTASAASRWRSPLAALIGSPLLLSGAFSAQGSANVDKVVWQPLSERAITDALAQNKRVFIDVTADWCVTCKANKYNVLLRDEVQQALSAPDVVALRGDWSKPKRHHRRLPA